MSKILTPPHNIEAEQSVLGGLLRDNDAFDRLITLRPDHFYLGDHQTIYAAIQRNLLASRAVDPISLAVQLAGKIENAQQYLVTLAAGMPSAATVAHHAGIVRDAAVKRSIMQISRDLHDQAATGGEDSAQLLDQASAQLERLTQVQTKSEPERASLSLAAHIGEIQRRIEGQSRGISTGYPDLDKRLGGGLRGGQLIIIGGRPKMGKTALALNIALNVAPEHSVLVLSQEMKKAELHDRNLACLGHIHLDRIINAERLDGTDWSGLTHAITKINDMELYLEEQGGLRLLDVRSKARTIKRKHGLKLVVIDYLQLMVGDGDNRNAQIEAITRGLKALAMELDMSILLLSQLNRKVEERPNKRPLASDLRDSGSIEQDADAVALVYRDEYYNPETIDKGVVEVNIPLCRAAAPGIAYLTYIGEQTRFESVAHGWHPAPPKTSAPRRGFTAD